MLLQFTAKSPWSIIGGGHIGLNAAAQAMLQGQDKLTQKDETAPKSRRFSWQKPQLNEKLAVLTRQSITFWLKRMLTLRILRLLFCYLVAWMHHSRGVDGCQFSTLFFNPVVC
ncbi:MAG: hypothetical protein CSA50_02845 [Gammaproteobacteria bacterium]|nr:MAG: hypothetical protein CSA50_02845 [Gammaproteobacteria bacterium]